MKCCCISPPVDSMVSWQHPGAGAAGSGPGPAAAAGAGQPGLRHSLQELQSGRAAPQPAHARCGALTAVWAAGREPLLMRFRAGKGCRSEGLALLPAALASTHAYASSACVMVYGVSFPLSSQHVWCSWLCCLGPALVLNRWVARQGDSGHGHGKADFLSRSSSLTNISGPSRESVHLHKAKHWKYVHLTCLTRLTAHNAISWLMMCLANECYRLAQMM